MKQNAFAVSVFCKALVVFVVLKIGLIWSISEGLIALREFTPSPSFVVRILFSPAQWGSEHLSVFYWLCLVFLTVVLFLRWNYVIGIIFFLLVINLYRLNVSISNGSDYVLIMLAFWSIGMSTWSAINNKYWNAMMILVFNATVLLCQLQIVFIYLVSGWDKLTSQVWRSGDAMNYIAHLDFFYNQRFDMLDNHYVNLTLSWITIVFELAFVILIWFKRTRLILLIIGITFHFIIWVMLTLPDFALIMMISYLIFLKDSDYNLIQKGIRLKPL